MIGKSRRYKTLDFTDSVQVVSQTSNGFSYIIQDVKKDVPLRTNVNDKANYHGGYSSNTLAGPRLFTFTGKVIGTKKDKRNIGLSLLMNKIKPEGNPNISNRGFYDLERQTDGGDERTCKAKVYQMITPTNGLDDPIIEYTFELYSETEKIYSPTVQTVSGFRGFFGGVTLPTTLPTYLAGFSGSIPLTNNGDWFAPIKIQVVGTCTNPKILNLTNNNKYRITGTTNNLILDNRNINNNPLETFIVTDSGTDIKKKRSSGADIFLDPGLNHIVVLTDDPTETPTVTITFRDTYIF